MNVQRDPYADIELAYAEEVNRGASRRTGWVTQPLRMTGEADDGTDFTGVGGGTLPAK